MSFSKWTSKFKDNFCTPKEMGVKSKKGAKSPLQKESTKPPRSWPNLPTQLLTILAYDSTLMQNIYYGGNVTKSYREQSRKCNPVGKSPFPLLCIHGNGQTGRSRDPYQYVPELFNTHFPRGYLWWFGIERPPPYGPYSFPGRILITGTAVWPGSYWLWSPNGTGRWKLPPWDVNVPFKHIVISSSDDRSSIFPVMVLTGIQKPAFVFCEPGRAWPAPYAWFKQDSTLVEPHSSNHQLMQFTNGIAFKGKFYALSLQGTLAVIEIIGSHLRITSLGTKRAVPIVQFVRFKEYLIESNGEILLVFLIFMKSIHKVENIEVYHLKFDRLSWVKMVSIGDRTLFLGTNCCTSVDASKIGCSVNCIYFSYETADEWWVYDMERESISPGGGNCFVLQNSLTKKKVSDVERKQFLTWC